MMNQAIMKQLFITVITTSIFFNTYSQNEGLARVRKINGIEAYFMSEPLRDYDVLFDVGGLLDFKSNFKAKSLLTGGFATENVSEKANQLCNRIVEKATKDGHDVDAIIYSSAKTAVAIKFNDEPTQNNKGIARVNKINNVEVYVLSEPLRKHVVVSEGKAKSGKGKSIMTAGLVNSTIEEDINKLVDKTVSQARRKRKQIDGVIYSSGKEGIGIKFE